MKSSVPARITARLPFSGVPTILKLITSITSEIRNITAVMGSTLPASAAATEPFHVPSHSRAVACLSSVPIAKTVTITTKIISIMGMKLGER